LITVVIPVKEDPKLVDEFIKHYLTMLLFNSVLVFDGGGGEALEEYADYYEKTDVSFWEARKKGISMVKTKYTFNIDVDTFVTKEYFDKAIKLLESDPSISAVAINYDPDIQYHLAFGTSIWRTSVLKELYDWHLEKHKDCECLYMWKKVEEKGLKVGTLPFSAVHKQQV
jgi:hypothetical protein